MIPCNAILRLSFLYISITFSVFILHAQDGKQLFSTKCASCHNIFKDLTGPKLGGVLEKEKYGGDPKKTYEWIRNSTSLVNSDPYYSALKNQWGSVMTAFPDLKDAEIDAIWDYINKTYAAGNKPKPAGDDTAKDDLKKANQNSVIFGIITLILAIIALILAYVNSNLKKMSDDAEGIIRPEPVPFYKNKFYIALLSVLLFVVGGYLLAKGAIGLGRQTNYQPEQPIYYSHKVHAGINQINCLYCHSSAWESKHASIPSVNVCMNCHKAIQAYEKGPEIIDENGNKIDGTAEIQKLYKYAGFDPKNAAKWDPSKAKPIEWVRIHNLPDHVYFNHAQHVRVGKIQCQTCHGEITNMHEVKQVSELSMGWCINCHRQTKVDFNYSEGKGNQFYSIYEKFHNEIKKGKMDSITVSHIGGLECQKCHY
ncbi:MAG: c-type cytochrome [Chitinophagaceae bacterium]|nr:c-type cytochrome [Chitinophagaceae bacterium]